MNKSRWVGYTLAILLGGFGAHLFYLRRYIRATFYLLFCWTLIPYVLALIDLFFIHKWVREDPGMLRRQKRRIASNQNTSPYDESSLELTSQHVRSISAPVDVPITLKAKVPSAMNREDLHFKSAALILPEFAQLRTPESIRQQIVRAQCHSFAKQSFAYRTKSAPPREHVPLQAYYTTFENLNRQQLQWYLFWRSEVLNRRYPVTDLSYIFLFVYELINYTFHEDAALNASLLVHLHEHYRHVYPNLSHYVMPWLADFLTEIGETELASHWQTVGALMAAHLSDLYTRELLELPTSYYRSFAVSYRETEFYKRYGERVDTLFPQSLKLLQNAYQSQGETLLDRWVRKEVSISRRALFPYSVLARTVPIMDREDVRYTIASEMHEDLSQLFRVTENVARQIVGEKRRLRVDLGVLPPGLAEALSREASVPSVTISEVVPMPKSRFIKVSSGLAVQGTPIPRPPEVSLPLLDLDEDRIRQLTSDSADLQRLLEDSTTDVEPEQPAMPQPADDPEWDASWLESMIGSSNEIDAAAFIASLTPAEADFLRGFQSGGLGVVEANAVLKRMGVLPGVVMNSINEKALLHLDDNLLEVDGNRYVIYEEFSGILVQLQKGA